MRPLWLRPAHREHLHREIRRLRSERDQERRLVLEQARTIATLTHQRNVALEKVRRLRDEMARGAV